MAERRTRRTARRTAATLAAIGLLAGCVTGRALGGGRLLVDDVDYLAATRAEHDGCLARWTDAGAGVVGRSAAGRSVPSQEVRVFIDAQPAGLRVIDARDAVVEAFRRWERTGIPVRFRFVDRPTDAAVRVGWLARARGDHAGVTTTTFDAQGLLQRASVLVAAATSGGTAYTWIDLRAIALHEVGHALGLGHAGSPVAIMAPAIRVNDLGLADELTVRLLYAAPAATCPATVRETATSGGAAGR